MGNADSRGVGIIYMILSLVYNMERRALLHLELPPRRPSDARADKVNPGQVRQRLQVFKVSRDIRVVEANLGQVQQRLEVFDVSHDARVVEANHGQLHQRLQVFNVSRDARVVEENHGQL